MTTPLIYSYRRVSTLKQEDGSGMEIQNDEQLLKNLSEKYQMEVSDRFYDDLGVSSFRGKNVENGELGLFIDDVKAGKVAKGSILAIRSLDRITRQGVRAGERIYGTLVDLGIRIFSEFDDRLFGSDSENELMDSITSALVFQRAWFESDNKSKMTTKATVKQIEDFKNDADEKDEDGYRKAIKVSGRSVWWVDESSGFVRPHKRLFPIAQEICKRIQEGQGTNRIIDWLNATHEPPKRRNKNVDSSPWSHSNIQKIHKTGALFGQKRFNIYVDGREDKQRNKLKPTEFILDNYYPAVITKDEYLAIKEARRQRTPKKGTKDPYVSLLTGMQMSYCLNCEDEHPHPLGTLKTQKGYRRIYCIYGSRKGDSACTGWSTQAKWIEKPLLDLCKDKLWRAPEVDSTEYLAGLSKVEELTKKIRKLVLSLEIADDDDMYEITERIKELRAEQQEQKALNEAEQSRLATRKSIPLEDLENEWEEVTARALDEGDHEARQQVRNLLQKSVEAILIGRNADTEVLTIYILFVDGDERLICSRGDEVLSHASIGTPAAKTEEFLKHELPRGTALQDAVKLVQRDVNNLSLVFWEY